MPSLKMKMKSTMGCLRETNGLHVCQKSNKIFKNSLSQAKSLQQEAQLDTFISNKKDDSACSEVTVQELRCNETSCCALLEDKDSGSINKNTCEYEKCNVSDFFISDMIVSSSPVEEATCLLPDYKYDESSIFLDDEYMLLTFLEDSVDCDDRTEHFSEPVVSSQESNLYMAIHQLKSNSQEPDVNNYFDWDPSECFDPQMFINNLPDLSEVVSPSERKKTVTLVLDLDETLVHSFLEHCDDADFSFRVFIDFKEHTVYVKQRPYVKEFLERVSEMFQIVVFTASLSIYANQLLDILDPHGKIISRRAYRESCVFADGIFTKDLTVLGVDLAKVAIIDNCPQVFRFQINNGIPIKSWFDDPSDHALISLLPFLETLADAKDVRPLIAKRFGNKE